ncbi:MAG: hypothetical protein QOD06_479 [Candidatus Binatota bacterium]|jgi:lipopolysaccharide/colanic/teichoic acid biosynthesis glycosyltransferase|nr:hypothetical protein [Candidatus Binatota bacterium]
MKRLFDVIVAGAALVLLAPLTFAIAVAVRVTGESSVIFRQRRVGRDGHVFEILKFRTMRTTTGPRVTAAGDPRITAIGGFLRRSKLDELPQLWNVVRGDMSLVGPRPELPEYVRLYPDEARAVLAVRPGITGPAQLDGFDEEEELGRAEDPERFYVDVVLPRKLRADLEYVRGRSLAGDFAVLWHTVSRVSGRRMRRSGVAVG